MHYILQEESLAGLSYRSIDDLLLTYTIIHLVMKYHVQTNKQIKSLKYPKYINIGI